MSCSSSRHRLRAAAFGLALWGTASSPAFAANYFWLNFGVGGHGWTTPGNWFYTQGCCYPQTSSDSAIFDPIFAGAPADAVSVTLPAANLANGALVVRNGTVSLSFAAGGPKTYLIDTLAGSESVLVGTTSGAPAALSIVSATGLDQVRTTRDVMLGVGAGTTGTLNVGFSPAGGQKIFWVGSGTTYVGRQGAGALNIGSGSTMLDAGAILGSSASAQGTANVKGAWTNAGGLTVGVAGDGVLNLQNGGSVHTQGAAAIGWSAGGTGAVNATGGAWTVDGTLYVGGNGRGAGGTGVLNVDVGTVSAHALDVYDPGTVNVSGGMLSIANAFTLRSGSKLNLSAGTLMVAFEQMSIAANAFHWTGGTVQTAGGATIQTGTPLLGGALTLGNDMGLVANAIAVGESANGVLNIDDGGHATSVDGFVGSMAGAGTTATVSMNGASEWSLSGALNIADETAAILALAGGAHITSNGLFASAATGGGHSRISLSGAGTHWDDTGDAYFGGVLSAKGGDGLLSIATDAKLAVTNLLRLWSGYEIALDGGLLEAGAMELFGDVTALGTSGVKARTSLAIGGGAQVSFGSDAVFDVQGANVNIAGGALLTGDLTGDAATAVTVSGAGTKWTVPGGLEIGTSGAGPGHLGSFKLGVGATTTAAGLVSVLDGTKFALAGGTLNAPSVAISSQDFSGYGTINANFHASGNVTATGDLTLGNAASVSGVVIGGALDVGTNHVTINKKGFYLVGNDTRVAGGTLSARNGLALAVGTGIAAAGTLDGRIAAQAGSYIEATGDLAMGDGQSVAGYFSDGELAVSKYHVTLLDANEALLGSVTTLDGGTLTAANGAVLEYAKNMTGHGTIDTPDDVLRAFVNNGDILGDSAAAPIVMTGYVKGVGSFDNVVFQGTYSPGASPSIVHVGSIVYDAGSTLVMELAGLEPGAGGYDQIIHDGTATLGGTLEIHLLDGFLPAAGESFTLMLAAEIAAGSDFASVIFPQVAGVAFALERTATSLTLKASAVPVPPAFLLFATALFALRRRRA